jgi:hypothetical protein
MYVVVLPTDIPRGDVLPTSGESSVGRCLE